MPRVFTLSLLFVFTIQGADTTTAQFDNSRGSYNSSESILTPTAVSKGISVVGSFTVDGAVYAQTLVVSSAPLCASRSLFVATMHGSVYCFDARQPGSSYVWKSTLVTPVTSFITTSVFFYGREVGCLSTPVVDVASNRLYVVCGTSTPSWKVFILNATNGETIGSATISGQVTGTGCIGTSPADTTSGANLVFFPAYELQRAPLTLSGSTLLISFAGWDDMLPWHGWAISYDVSGSTPSQSHIWNSTPTGCGGGIWQSGGGISNDGTFYYLATGNGDYDGVSNFGMSIVKLDSSLAVSDWFTPSNFATLNAEDADFSSGRVMIIPGENFITFGSKDYYVRLLSTSSLGHLTASPLQQFLTNPSPPTPTGASGIYGGAFANGQGFFPNVRGGIYAFTYSSGSYNTTPVVTSATYSQTQGMTITSSSGSNEILWAITTTPSAYGVPQIGVLRAFNPATLAEYTNTGTSLGQITKFQSPTIADGNIYVGTLDGTVKMLGLRPSTQLTGAASLNGASLQ